MSFVDSQVGSHVFSYKSSRPFYSISLQIRARGFSTREELGHLNTHVHVPIPVFRVRRNVRTRYSFSPTQTHRARRRRVYSISLQIRARGRLTNSPEPICTDLRPIMQGTRSTQRHPTTSDDEPIIKLVKHTWVTQGPPASRHPLPENILYDDRSLQGGTRSTQVCQREFNDRFIIH